MDAIQFGRISAPPLLPQPGKTEQPREGAFAEMLADATKRVGELQKEADAELRAFLAGEPVELHEVILAGEEGALAFQFMMAVRNKVVDAYQEIMRMQV